MTSGRERPVPGSQWSAEGGRPNPRGYPPQRAPSGRPHFTREGRSYGDNAGGEASPGRQEGGGYGQTRGPGGGEMQGHRLKESDFPLEMGGRTKTEKQPQLRPRGKDAPLDESRAIK